MPPLFYITLTPVVGYTIGQCAIEAVDIAKRLGVAVEFTMNGIYLNAYPETPPEDIVANYRDQLASKK